MRAAVRNTGSPILFFAVGSLFRKFMKRILLFAFLLQTLCLSAQNNLSKRYVMRPRADGLLYFVLPFDLPGISRGKAANLDITYVTSYTQCNVNMSLWTPEPLRVDSVVFSSGRPYRADSLTLLFVEKSKANWWHRLSFKVDFDTLSALYETTMPYRLSVYAEGKVFQYAFPSRKWPAECRWMSEWLRLIAYNRDRL